MPAAPQDPRAERETDQDPATTTQVKALLGTIDLTGAVVTADSHASRETAAHIAGQRGRGLPADRQGQHAGTPRAIFDKIQSECDAAAPDHTDTDRSHGRIVRRSVWAAAGEGIGFRTQPRSSASAATPST